MWVAKGILTYLIPDCYVLCTLAILKNIRNPLIFLWKMATYSCFWRVKRSKILLQASLHRLSDLLTLVSFYIITDFSRLCKSKSCTEYSATTARYCSRIACTATATRFRSVQSAHKNIMYTRVFIIYLHGVHTLFIFFSYTKFIENQQCELIVWSNCT